MDNRLQKRRGALTSTSIRLTSRRGAICEASGLLAHLDAVAHETETLRVTRAALLQEDVSNGPGGRLRPMSTVDRPDRRQSVQIDWDNLRRDILCTSMPIEDEM